MTFFRNKKFFQQNYTNVSTSEFLRFAPNLTLYQYFSLSIPFKIPACFQTSLVNNRIDSSSFIHKLFRSYKIKRESFAYKNNFSYICTSIKTYTVSYTKDSVIILCPINGFLKFEIMDLITQIQGIGYSFVYGIIFTFVYHFIYSHLIKIKIKFIYFIMQCCFGIIFAAIYFIGLLKINEGILRAYFLVSVLAGYVIYQNLMHEKMYIMIVKINQKLTRLFKPVRFVFLKFDGIIGSIKKRVKR